jgi:hypothetical protein
MFWRDKISLLIKLYSVINLLMFLCNINFVGSFGFCCCLIFWMLLLLNFFSSNYAKYFYLIFSNLDLFVLNLIIWCLLLTYLSIYFNFYNANTSFNLKCLNFIMHVILHWFSWVKKIRFLLNRVNANIKTPTFTIIKPVCSR